MMKKPYLWNIPKNNSPRIILTRLMFTPTPFFKLQINPIFKKPKDLTNVRIYKSWLWT